LVLPCNHGVQQLTKIQNMERSSLPIQAIQLDAAQIRSRVIRVFTQAVFMAVGVLYSRKIDDTSWGCETNT